MNALVETISYMITGHYSDYYKKELKPYILTCLASFAIVFVVNAFKLAALI